MRTYCVAQKALLSAKPCVRAKPIQLCPTLCHPMTAAHQTPVSMGFSRQEYWSGLPSSRLSALWWPKWEGNLKKSRYVYRYNWFALPYGRNEHSIVEQLFSSNK